MTAEDLLQIRLHLNTISRIIYDTLDWAIEAGTVGLLYSRFSYLGGLILMSIEDINCALFFSLENVTAFVLVCVSTRQSTVGMNERQWVLQEELVSKCMCQSEGHQGGILN